MFNKGTLKWLCAIGMILLLIAATPQIVSAVLASTLYLPLVHRSAPPTATPTPTPTRTPTPTATQKPMEIVNPGFEQKSYGWVVYSSQGDSVISNERAYNGHYSAELGNGNDDRFTYISQSFTVPYDEYYLTYWQYTDTNETCDPEDQYDDTIIIYVDGEQLPGGSKYEICEVLGVGWSKNVHNLISKRGQTIVFRIEFHSDFAISSEVFIDDFDLIP